MEVRPMRMAINVRALGRYANQYDQERTDEIFTRVFQHPAGGAGRRPGAGRLARTSGGRPSPT